MRYYITKLVATDCWLLKDLGEKLLVLLFVRHRLGESRCNLDLCTEFWPFEICDFCFNFQKSFD